jgi:hypothetical protein
MNLYEEVEDGSNSDSEENSNWKRESKYRSTKLKNSRNKYYNIYYCINDNNNPVNENNNNQINENNNNMNNNGNNNFVASLMDYLNSLINLNNGNGNNQNPMNIPLRNNQNNNN